MSRDASSLLKSSTALRQKAPLLPGTRNTHFTKDKTFTVLDWGRGVWPHTNTWYWGNGSTYLDGKLFGFELTWGFGDESNATETAIFYDGKCHKIGAVHLEKDPEDGAGWMNEWHFISEDGRLDLTMKPYYDHYTNLLPLNLFGMKTQSGSRTLERQRSFSTTARSLILKICMHSAKRFTTNSDKNSAAY